MRFLKILFCLIISVILILSTVSCDNTDKAYIYFRLPEKPSTLDPQTAKTDAELLIVKNVFEGLLRKDQDGKIVCAIAKSYKKEKLTYTFELRKDAKWSNGENITAHDFEFAFKRAVSPKTQSPFVSRLFCIKSAKEIYNGNSKINTLGVKALNDYTLQIELAYEDENFEEILTTAIAMPCNENFFNQCSGKYGLFSDTLLSNGSYRLAKWGKEVFGIRLYRNKEYNGQFISKNAAVFLSHDDKLSAKDVLLENDADIAFIDCKDIKEVRTAEFKTVSYDNICWFLTISDGFSKGIRKSLLTLANKEVFANHLIDGYTIANSIFPTVLNLNSTASGMLAYNLQSAKELFKNEIKNLKDKKFPPNVTLYYFDDGFSKNIVNDIVGHWQNNLGAFVNIETVSEPNVLLSQLKTQTYGMCIFPVRADSYLINEYLEKFGISYNKQNLKELQIKILESNNIAPIMFQSTNIAYNKNLSNLQFEHGNGYIDFAFIIKKEK